MATALERIAYNIGQAARVGWYGGQYLIARRIAMAGATSRQANPRIAVALRQGLRDLLRQDWAHVAAGAYLAPEDLFAPPVRELRLAVDFFADLPAVVARRREGRAQEPAERAARATGLPRYYLQNFHFQSDGYLSERSARLYDRQVEILFTGTADAMRRQALPAIAAAMRGRRQASMRLADIGCGTGRFLRAIKQNWPRLPVTGIDLSDSYLSQAERALKPWRDVTLALGKAEALPFRDASLDVVTSVYLFHELPRRIRAAAAAEFARCLRKGGRLVLVDSLQHGDTPALDPLLDAFPAMFHEPYYKDYLRHDLGLLFAERGLQPISAEPAFLSKVFVFERV